MEYKSKGSFLGWFIGLAVPVQGIFILPWLLQSAQYTIFFSPRTLFNFMCPHHPATCAGTRAGSPVSKYVSLVLPHLSGSYPIKLEERGGGIICTLREALKGVLYWLLQHRLLSLQLLLRVTTAKGSDVPTYQTLLTSPPQPTVAEQTTCPPATCYFLLAVVERPYPKNFSTFCKCTDPVHTWDSNSCLPVQELGALTKCLASRMRQASLHFPDRDFSSSHFPQELTPYKQIGDRLPAGCQCHDPNILTMETFPEKVLITMHSEGGGDGWEWGTRVYNVRPARMRSSVPLT